MDPAERSVALHLAEIRELHTYKGFLKSSPKVTIWFAGRPSSPTGVAARTSIHAGPEPVATKANVSWVCLICSETNESSLAKCRLCGVQRSEEEEETPTTRKSERSPIEAVSASTNLPTDLACPRCSFLNMPGAVICEVCEGSLPQEGATLVSACPRCSFYNDPSAARCAICDGEMPPLRRQQQDSATSPVSVESAEMMSPSDSFEHVHPALDLSRSFVKIAFRGGGMAPFVSALNAALAAKAWEFKPLEPAVAPATTHFNPMRAGIAGIVRNVEETRQKTDASISEAFKDLDGLIAKAADMVRLAEQIAARLSTESAASDGGQTSAEDVSNFKNFLLDLGVASPVTKDSAGALYHQELAKQITEFLEAVLARERGLISLTDVYCLYNRARGVALISPEDLYKACLLFPELNVPMRLRKFQSGLVCIESLSRSDQATAQRFLNYIRQKGPLSAIDAAGLEGCAVALSTEQLLIAEAQGLLCRDESVEGLRFYENIFDASAAGLNTWQEAGVS